jgi:2,3,4,5-tetrahydropyridine-2,6-dicarboxylate N-succinyltransferase
MVLRYSNDVQMEQEPSMTTSEHNRHEFQQRLERLTTPHPDVVLARLRLNGQLVKILAQVPGESASLRIVAHHQRDGVLPPSAVAACLEVFAPLIQEAQDTPGRHPTIDLLRWLGQHQTVAVELLRASPGLFTNILAGSASTEELRAGVDLLDRGLVRCAEKITPVRRGDNELLLEPNATWVPQPYAIACMHGTFSAFPMQRIGDHYYDKVPLKTDGWSELDFERAGVRFIPGSFVRRGAYLGAGTAVMPGGIVNVGAYVAGAGVLIDGGARVATGAQIGRGVKLGAGSGVEGILEPLGRLPSIVEDNVKIGATCEVTGIIEEGAIIASGVVMASGKKIFDLRTGEEVPPRYMAIGDKVVEIPVVPARRVAVAGTYAKSSSLSIDCVVLLEKDAGDTAVAQIPRNAQLYLKVP